MPAEGGPSGAEWARSAQRLLGEAFERWDLVADGPLRTGWTAVVAPVRRDGEPSCVKVVRRSVDTDGEPVALRTWAGDGAVRLVGGAPQRGDAPARAARRRGRPALGRHRQRLQGHRWPAVPAARAGATGTAPAERLVGGLAARGRRRDALPRRLVSRARGLHRELDARPGERRDARPRRPALRERAGRGARAMARDRPAAAGGPPGVGPPRRAAQPARRARDGCRAAVVGAAPDRGALRRGRDGRGASPGAGRSCGAPSSASGRSTTTTPTRSRSTSPWPRPSTTEDPSGTTESGRKVFPSDRLTRRIPLSGPLPGAGSSHSHKEKS